ncbi:MAG: hypothetical protein ACPHYG_06460, partial [Flavobacteriales bacterium]
VFPYNLPSRQALIRLIKETNPRFNLKEKYAHFEPPHFAPTDSVPGRTFIEVEQTDLNLKRWYVYRRLDFAVTFRNGINIKLEAPVTSRRIVEEINRTRNMALTEADVALNDQALTQPGMPATWTMKAKPESYVWFGEVSVYVEPLDRPANIRLLEDGSARLIESGKYRLLEVV